MSLSDLERVWADEMHIPEAQYQEWMREEREAYLEQFGANLDDELEDC